MLGLGEYDSSEGEDEELSKPNFNSKEKNRDIKPPESISPNQAEQKLPKARPTPAPSIPPVAEATGPVGPQVGPFVPPEGAPLESNGTLSVPNSPYTTSRQSVRNLTLPPVPNFDIAPSPPGSPPPGSSEKFARFLELKKKGIHFNEKLENSSALRNPSLLHKLRDFAGIDDEQQYSSSLPKELAVPIKYPEWAYADQLNKMQQDVAKRKEKERAQQQREAIDFVPASAAASGASSRSATPGAAVGRGGPKSAAERVMAGLDRDSSSPGGRVAGSKRTDGGMRKSRFDVK